MAKTTTLLLSVVALQTASLLFLAASAAPSGFTADLIRRSSPKAPRSRLRLRSPSLSGGSPYADIAVDSGDDGYVMKIQIGTPPFEISGIADTGSDIIWTQCLPCVSCYKQDAPIFNPISSSTYKDVPCVSSKCQIVKSGHCDSGDQGCPYTSLYGDPTAFSIGTVGTDTVTLKSTSGEPFVLPETAIGCGHNNNMSGSEMSGIIGLGWGPASLVSQMGDAIQGLFSYCLGVETSKINFGANAIVSGDGTVSTTMYRKHNNHPTNYYLNLDAVSVGGSRLETAGTSFHATDGNIFIDSGTTYTFLPQDYFSRVKEAVVSAVKGAEPAPQGPSGELCYKSKNIEDFPVITMHFTGADLVLDRPNTYWNLSPDLICLTIVASKDVAIFGNLAHYNFLVGYDTQSELVSFKPTNCSALWS